MRRTWRRKQIVPILWGIMAVILLPGSAAWAVEPLVIAGSPMLAAPLQALAQTFEETHPDVKVKLHYESAIDLRRTIAQMQNTGRHFIESGPFHLFAPGGGEIITRLEQKYYILPGTRRPYALARLVLVVPATLVEAPASFEELAKNAALRVSIVDPKVNETGRLTRELLEGMGLADALKGRLDIAHDSSGVLDHVLHGQADVGIVLNPEAYRHQDRIRVVAQAPEGAHSRIVYEMAMERFCPDRRLCQEFLDFTRSPAAQAALKRLGYGVPAKDASASNTR